MARSGARGRSPRSPRRPGTRPRSRRDRSDLRRAWGTTRPTMTSEPFAYRGDELYCEAVPLARIAEEVGTPVYVYSRGELERAYRAFDAALDGIPHRVCYAVKANASLGILHVLIGLGAGADIVSQGELVRWIKAGGDPGKVVFSGVGKTERELGAALAAGIG